MWVCFVMLCKDNGTAVDAEMLLVVFCVSFLGMV